MTNAPLTTSDAAKILHTTPENVRLLNRKGKLPAMRTVSGMRLFTRESVEKFAADRERKRQDQGQSAA